jgi:hypothetical protein
MKNQNLSANFFGAKCCSNEKLLLALWPCESFLFRKFLKKITKNVGFLDHLHLPMDGCQRLLCLLQTFSIEMCYPYALCTVAVEAIISHHLEPFKKNNNAQCTNNLWMPQIFQHEYHNHNTFLLYRPHVIRRFKPQ